MPNDNPAVNYERYFVPAIGAPLATDLVRHAELPGRLARDPAPPPLQSPLDERTRRFDNRLYPKTNVMLRAERRWEGGSFSEAG